MATVKIEITQQEMIELVAKQYGVYPHNVIIVERDIHNELLQDIMPLLKEHRWDAIRIVRGKLDLSLYEAKKYVDNVIEDLNFPTFT